MPTVGASPGSSYYACFTTINPATGAAVNADSLPTVVPYKNAVNDAATFTLTVANISTGLYKVTGTVPAGYVGGDSVTVVITATVSAILGVKVIDEFLVAPANYYSQVIDSSGRVDVGKILGTASQGAAGYMGVDWGQIANKTSTVALTNTTISTSQAVASVSGAVGSVTGAVGSISGVTFPTHFNSLAITAAGGVTLGDDVAHGGTPGSSTATFAMERILVDSTSGAHPAVMFRNSGGNDAFDVFATGSGGYGMYAKGTDGYAVAFEGLVTDPANYAPALLLQSRGTDAPIVEMTGMSAESGVGLSIRTHGHGVSIVADGTGSHGIISTGGTDGDGFHGVGAGTGVGFSSVPDATGFGGSGGLDAAGVRAAVGLASANLDTQLAAIKSDTGSTVTTLATMTTTLATIAGYVDTEVATILATVTTIAGNVSTIVTQTASPLTAAQLRAALGMASADLDAQLDFILASLGDVAGLDAAGIRAAIGLSTNNLDTQLGDLPTAAENADKLLGRNLEGGSDSGRTVREAMYFLRNKWWIAGGFVHVCDTSDVEVWSGIVTQSGATPVVGIDPS